MLYLIFFASFFASCYPFFMLLVYKDFGQTEIKDDHFLALIGGLAAAANGISRLFIAYFVDKIGCKKVYFLVLASQLLIALTVYWSVRLEWIYMI